MRTELSKGNDLLYFNNRLDALKISTFYRPNTNVELYLLYIQNHSVFNKFHPIIRNLNEKQINQKT